MHGGGGMADSGVGCGHAQQLWSVQFAGAVFEALRGSELTPAAAEAKSTGQRSIIVLWRRLIARR